MFKQRTEAKNTEKMLLQIFINVTIQVYRFYSNFRGSSISVKKRQSMGQLTHHIIVTSTTKIRIYIQKYNIVLSIRNKAACNK